MLIEKKEDLKKIIDSSKGKNQKVLIKRGVFDIIHPGHIYSIKKLKEQADVLIMLTVSDDLVRKKKGDTRPINSQRQRSEVVDGLKGVDYVFADTSKSREEYIELLHYLRPNMLAVTLGDEKKKLDYTSKYWELLEIRDKRKEEFSTTNIIERVLDKYKKLKH